MAGWLVALLTAAIVALLGMRADVPHGLSADHSTGVLESAAEVHAVARGLRTNAPPGGLHSERAAAGPTRLYVEVSTLTPARRRALETAGLTIELPPPGKGATRWHRGELVQGLASPGAEVTIARLPFVRRIDRPGYRFTNAGTVDSTGDAVLHTDVARAVLGTEGAGVEVGVISDGADNLAASVASGDLPPDIVQPAIPGVTPGHGDEGTALLEIVHDVAPAAQLLFASPRTSAEMVAAIDGLAAAGARVIVDDLVFTDEPKFEDGPIAQAAERFVAGGGVYVTAAGNYARAHYFATYRPGSGTTLGGLQYHALHRFADNDFGNSFRIPAGGEVIVVLQWNDPFGEAADDFDLLLARPSAGSDILLASSTEAQDGGGNPLEALRWANTTGGPVDAYVAIGEFARHTDAGSLRLNLVFFSRDALRLQYASPRESIFGHAAADQVLSVAAADVASPDLAEDFSSNGPASLFFPARTTRNVPLLTAIDDVETAIGRRGGFVNPFRGTSAAAPHVAGCGALLLAAGAEAATVSSAMLATAIDLAPPGFDDAAGNGRLDCGAAARLATGSAHPPAIAQVTGRFTPAGAVTVDADGADADGDARGATIRLLDRAGDELARADADAQTSGTTFHVTASARGPLLARVRAAAVRAHDATRLSSAEVVAAIACPGDVSLGDALCAVGELVDAVSVLPGRRARRLERTAEAVTVALVRAGEATDTGQTVRARHALRVAQLRLGKLVHLAAARSLDPDVRRQLNDAGQLLRARVATLRAST